MHKREHLRLCRLPRNRKNIEQGDGKRIFSSELIFRTSTCQRYSRRQAEGLRRNSAKTPLSNDCWWWFILFQSGLSRAQRSENEFHKLPLLPNISGTQKNHFLRKKMNAKARLSRSDGWWKGTLHDITSGTRCEWIATVQHSLLLPGVLLNVISDWNLYFWLLVNWVINRNSKSTTASSSGCCESVLNYVTAEKCTLQCEIHQTLFDIFMSRSYRSRRTMANEKCHQVEVFNPSTWKKAELQQKIDKLAGDLLSTDDDDGW